MIVAAYVFVALLKSSQAVRTLQPVLGVDDVIREIKSFAAKSEPEDPVKTLSGQSGQLQAQLISLSPQAAADAWIGLVENWQKLVKKDSVPDTMRKQAWIEVMNALPPHASWPLIRSGLNRLPVPLRGQVGALFDDLLGREDKVLAYLEGERNPNADPANQDSSSPDSWIDAAEMPIALRTMNLGVLEKLYIRQAQGDPFPGACPDLVKQFGRKRAEPILRKMLASARGSFNGFEGAETAALARSIVASDPGHVKAPQWSLVRGMDDFPFLSAQIKLFGMGQFGNSDASFLYAMGLAKRGHINQAAQIVAKYQALGNSEIRNASRKDQATFFELFPRIIDQQVDLYFTRSYKDLGYELRRLPEVSEQLGKWVQRTDLSTPTRAGLLAWKGRIDCGFGRIQQGIAELEESAKLKWPAADSFGSDPTTDLLSIAEALRDDHILAFLQREAKSKGGALGRLDFFEAYDLLGESAHAQMASIETLQDVHNVKSSAQGQGRLLNAYPGTGVELAELYYKANEPQQVLTLLKEYPRWGAADLQDIIEHGPWNDFYYSSKLGDPLGFYAAWALAKTGNMELAIRVLHGLVSIDRTNDDSYQLLNRLEDARALGFYDAMIREHPDEPRPLIWKGELLLRTGRPEAAEKLLDEAIALDPTDANTLPGHRGEAYAILGQVLSAEKRKGVRPRSRETPQSCSRAVRAARLTESARRAELAGLYSIAAAGYKAALAVNPRDGYAWTRYAYSLNGIGRKQEALAAYAKAVELIPTSDGAAGGADSVNEYGAGNAEFRQVAEGVLPLLRKAHPKSPAVLWAMASVEEQGRNFKAAFGDYEEAARLNPGYVRAWEGMVYIASQGDVSREQAKRAVLGLLRADPLSWRGLDSAAIERFGDYAALYDACEEARRSVPPRPKGPLFALEASERGLARGLHPLQEYRAPLEQGPGAVLAGIPELQALFPR